MKIILLGFSWVCVDRAKYLKKTKNIFIENITNFIGLVLMNISDLALRLAIVFLPGIISTLLVRHFTIHQPFTNTYLIIYSFISGMGAYVALGIFKTKLIIWNALLDSTSKPDFDEVFLASLLAIPLGIIYSAIIHHKLLIRFARLIKVSNRIGDDDIWSYFLNAKKTDWVYIRNYKNNLTYFGKVISFSETDRPREILLEDVSVYDTETSKFQYDSPAIYLAGENNDFSIEYYNINHKEKTNANKRTKPKSKSSTAKKRNSNTRRSNKK